MVGERERMGGRKGVRRGERKEVKGGDGRGRDRVEKERMHREVGRIGEGGDKEGGIQEGEGRGYLGGGREVVSRRGRGGGMQEHRRCNFTDSEGHLHSIEW